MLVPAARVGVVIFFGSVLLLGMTEAAYRHKESKASSMLVEPAQLQKILGEAKVRIIDVRSKEDYAKGHIPQAVRVDISEWRSLATSKGGLHDAKAWAEKVGGLGIEPDTRLVVYGSKLSDTARVWWLLKYLGVKNVAILNGGWACWTNEGLPTETTAPKIVATKFQPDIQADRLQEIEALKKSIKSPEIKVVDTRSSGEFTGKVVRGKRGGHIPGATHLEWKELLAKDGRFKTGKQLQVLFRTRGILPEQTAVCY